MRCRDCASLRSSTLYKVSVGRLLLTILLGLIVGTAGAAVLFEITFFVFFVGPIYGGIVAEAVLRASGRKRGTTIEVIGVGCIIVGALIAIAGNIFPILIAARSAGQGIDLSQILMAELTSLLWPLVGIALAVSACFSRLRYF